MRHDWQVQWAAGKEAPITALPRAIPLLPGASADAPATPSPGARRERPSAISDASAGSAESQSDQPSLSAAERRPSSSATAKQLSSDAVTGPSARHADSARHRPGLLVHAPAMPSLPGLVPRPLTLPEAVAEAITLAAYKQGSTDNLAALAVDLQPKWRSSSTLREASRKPQHADSSDRYGLRDRAGPELSGEGADYTLPWHSTGLIVPQHGERSCMLISRHVS